jgi:hypothetical protein
MCVKTSQFYNKYVRFRMSSRIFSPSSCEQTGLEIQAWIVGGIQAGLRLCSAGSCAVNRSNLPFDRSSESIAPVSDLLVIFSMCTVHPSAAATLPMAATSVVERLHEEL